jgi:nicotinate-nucleotide pyrophosphorylase (carboxylating)
MKKTSDIRDFIFFKIKKTIFLAKITSQEHGIISGTQLLREACKKIGIILIESKKNGENVKPSEAIAILKGNPKQIAMAEEQLIGLIAKASGIATAAAMAKKLAGQKLKVVSGAWKKMPPQIKDLVRQAITDGGIDYRISPLPFIYLDKNYVRLFGGVEESLLSIKNFKNYTKIIQLKSKGKRLCKEASSAARLGADIIMIDTGLKEDISLVDYALKEKGLRDQVKIAFAGNIKMADIKELRKFPVDIIDVGKAIVDAPLLNMRMDVIQRI